MSSAEEQIVTVDMIGDKVHIIVLTGDINMEKALLTLNKESVIDLRDKLNDMWPVLR